MSERQWLLRRSPYDLPSDQHLFLRVCHSQWRGINQRVLMLIRSLILAYMISVWVSALVQQIQSDKHAGTFPFRAGIVSYSLQLAYYAMTTIWTAQQQMIPRGQPPAADDAFAPHFLGSRVFSFLPVPRTPDFTDRIRFTFFSFYSAVHTFPLMITFLYWLAMSGSNGEAFDGIFLHNWVAYSLYAGNSIVTVLEILCLSSIRAVESVESNCVGLALIHALYLAWAYLGHAITGYWTTPLLDPKVYSGSQLTMHVLVSMALTLVAFLCVVGLHELKDNAVRSLNEEDY